MVGIVTTYTSVGRCRVMFAGMQQVWYASDLNSSRESIWLTIGPHDACLCLCKLVHYFHLLWILSFGGIFLMSMFVQISYCFHWLSSTELKGKDFNIIPNSLEKTVCTNIMISCDTWWFHFHLIWKTEGLKSVKICIIIKYTIYKTSSYNVILK